MTSFIKWVDKPKLSVRLASFAADGLELTAYLWVGETEAGPANTRDVVIPLPQRSALRGLASD